jgi:hypothetical protein
MSDISRVVFTVDVLHPISGMLKSFVSEPQVEIRSEGDWICVRANDPTANDRGFPSTITRYYNKQIVAWLEYKPVASAKPAK